MGKEAATKPACEAAVNASSSDLKPMALRQDILARGSSVIYNEVLARALSAVVPAGALPALAALADVLVVAHALTVLGL